ncbi:MAG: InlB B-repeat-containing protein [Oscillospiraceae bacterium]|nr:InlB B-repeat-containing protein [Oscillospiraceae bacterium]
MTANVTYVAQWEAGKASARRVTLPTIPGPDVDPAALDTGHKIDVRFTVLYVGSEFNIGYNYGTSESTTFVCQYKTNHSDTAYNNHTIAISDIKAAAGRATVKSGYQIVGWSKESNANPTTWSLNKSGTTACNKGTTIYLVAKNPNPTTKYTYTLNYDANGGTGAPSADSWSTTDASIRYHSFTVKNTIPTREGYVFKGWKANDGSDTIYTGGMTCAVSQYGNDVVKNGNTWTRTLYAVWEEATPPKPDKPTAPGEGDLSGLIGNITVNCTNGKAAHELKTKGYTLISGSYTTSEVAGDAENGYTYTVTINSQKYVEQFDTDTGAAHDPKGVNATVTLKYTDNGWTVTNGAPVVFNVACVTEIVPPAKPGAEDLAKLEAPVEVACTTKPETHTAVHFSLRGGTYTIGDVAGNETDGYTCDITVTADKYVARYNMDYGKHTLTGDNTKTLTLKYVEGQWAVDTPITFPVECEEDLFPVHLVIYRNGNTTTAYKDIALESQPKGHVIDLSTIDIADYYTGNYEFYGWYDDGLFNIYKSDPANPPAGLKEKTVNGWTNLKCMVYDKYQVVYFQSEEALRDFQNDHSKTEGRLHSTTALFGSTLPTADAPTPTRTGYTFKFWSREGQNGDVTGQTVNGWTNLYAVWEKNTYTVTYTDGVNGEAFADQAYTAKYEDATPAFEGTPARAGYKFLGWEPTVAETVTENATYVAQWEKLYTVTYTDGVDGKAFKDDVHSDLEKDTPTPAFSGGTPTRKGFVFDGWNPEVAETVTEDVTYTAQWKPVQPDKKAIEGAIGRGVAVVCDNQNVNHGEKKYKPTLGEYTVSNVMGTAADGYTCTVTVRAAKFIEKYSSDMGDAVHTLIAGEPAEKTIELKWNGEKWVAETELPVTFHTLCPPEQPSKKDIEGAIGRGVKIVCDNQNVNHWGKDYKPTQGEYTVSDVTGTASEGYTCTITVKAAKIVEKYSSDMGKTHALIVGEQPEKTVELKWDGEKWVAKTELPITFHVECPPEKPTYDELKGLGINAKVDCTTTTAHNGKSYTLIEGTYNVSDPERKGTAYTCILTVNAKDYVAKYNAEENVGPHTLDDRDSKTIELTWNGEKWTAAETSVTFNVKCELLTVTYTDGVKGEEVFADVVYKDIPYGTSTPAFGTKDPTREGYKFVGWEPEVAETVTENATYVAQWEKLYTVTYTDGAKGKAFEDQVFTDLESGTKTPEFNGTPTRKGYKFLGWEPVVADTVTENVTYTAQWEELYTVTYTDGVKGKAFKDQVYSDLESGTATPKFDGKPTRKGYTFTGWSPKVTDTVTKDVTYVAQWKSTKNGKDNVPKTGDSEIVMVLGSVLLFSFCGAAAVSVYDRKRKHF